MKKTILAILVIPSVFSSADYEYNPIVAINDYINYKTIDSYTMHKAKLAAAIYHAAPQSQKDRQYLAAIAFTESTFNYQAIGDNGQSKGAWQIQEKHWGYVDIDNPYQQARKALTILKACNYDLRKYNGGEYGWDNKQTMIYERKVRDQLKYLRSNNIG